MAVRVIITTEEDLHDIIQRCLKELLPQVSPLPADNKDTEIIDTALLCQRLGITEPTAIRHRKQGKIPFLKLGTSVRYNWQAVVKALENKKAKQ